MTDLVHIDPTHYAVRSVQLKSRTGSMHVIGAGSYVRVERAADGSLYLGSERVFQVGATPVVDTLLSALQRADFRLQETEEGFDVICTDRVAEGPAFSQVPLCESTVDVIDTMTECVDIKLETFDLDGQE